MKQHWTGRLLIAVSSVAIGLFLFLRNTGVREVRPTFDPNTRTIADAIPAADDWPWWRGNGIRNSSPSTDLPLTWSISQNVEWKTLVPGRGHSSPCLWGSHLFLTTSDDEKQTVSLLCLSKETGLAIWTTELHCGGLPEIHKKNTHASSSPACDGQFVYVASTVNGALRITAVNFEGRIEWQQEAGPYSSEWGFGSSPAIHKSMIIVSADNRGSAVDRFMGTSWIAALHRQTGKLIWRVKRGEGDSFGSPIVAKVAGRDQLLLAGKEWVMSYDPVSGDELWKCRWDIKRTANTLTFDDQYVYASARQSNPQTVCIKADGQGDVTETHVVWRDQKIACDVPSPIVHNGRFYLMADDGILTCLDSTDGKMIWKKRLGGNMSSSPFIANDHLICCNEEGQAFVLHLGPKPEIVAENSLGDGILASPVASGDRLYVRTLTSLFCVAGPRITPIANRPQESDKKL